MAEEATEEEEQKEKSLLPKIILIVVGVLLLIAITVAVTLFASGAFNVEEKEAEEEIAEMEAAEKAAAEEEAAQGPQLLETPVETKLDANYFQMQQALVANVLNSRKVMQVSIAIVTHYDQQVIDNIQKHEIALRSEILQVLSRQDESSIIEKTFRSDLAESIRLAINETLEGYEDFGGVEKVFFTEFIIQ